MEPIVVERTLQLASTAEELWPQISNTDRLNRALGVPAAVSAGTDPGDFAQKVSARLFGLTLSWRELPFDYVEGRHYRVVREFDGSPVARFVGELTLTPNAGGTAATVTGSMLPRWEWARPLVRLAVTKALADMAGIIARIDASIKSVGYFPTPPGTLTPVDEELFSARAKTLRAERVEPSAAERLIAHIKEAPDDEVRRMRPFELADRWALPRPAALAACLHAVKAGLLDLNWEILCPNCAAPKESLANLSQLKGKSHCDSCDIEYGVDLGASVELRFAVHPSVRAARADVFCAGSPAHSRHAKAQLVLDGTCARTVDLELGGASYTARCLQTQRRARLRPAQDGPAALSLDLAKEGGEELTFRPGAVALTLRPAGSPALVRIEKESWRDAAATGAYVTAMQEFRDLFSAEVLAPGVEIGVKNLALLFTDLKGSTAMYERVGDATAYAVVRDHFEWLTGLIAARRGAVVKTIGDAVMAVFASGADALEAALDMQERIDELSARLAPREPVALKIGVHQGPSIAINAGGVLDYFGTMVNVSARVQNESVGGDVVVTRAIYDDPVGRAVIARRAPGEQRVLINLKGLSGEFELRRLTPRAKAS